MTGKFYRGALILVALGSFASVPVLNAQPSPAATSRTPSCTRRKRWTMAHRVMLEALVTHAQKSLNFAEKGGKSSHLKEAVTHLTEAIEQGKRAMPTRPSRI